MSPDRLESSPREFAILTAGRFLAEHGVASAFISLLLLIPCFWHSRIQAGDLGSHVYNAWLAQLVERQQIPGLVIAPQHDNVLFDAMLLHAGDAMGFVAAEKVCVSIAVLIFFWGCFSFLAAISGRLPWLVIPFLLILTYGYVFHMGFMNYYISLGLAFLGVAIVWQGGTGNLLLGAALGILTFVAHPIGLLLFVALAGYVLVARQLRGRAPWRLLLPVVPLALMPLVRIYFALHGQYQADWRTANMFKLLGQDQVELFGTPYTILSGLIFFWAAWSFWAAVYDRVFRAERSSRYFNLAVELLLISAFAIAFIPENFRVQLYAGWIGLLVSRLTLVSAILLLLVLNSVALPRWSGYGFLALAVVFFGFLYRDTGKLDRMEASARKAISALPAGTRVVAVANAPSGWRLIFIHHSIERACVGRCFSVANYEPSSLQFRLRAKPGNHFVTNSVDTAEAMSSGDYVVEQGDLPLTSL